MTWDSGPMLPPGTVILTAEQVRALVGAMAAVGAAFEAFAAALAPLGQAAADAEPPDPDSDDPVHLRMVIGPPVVRFPGRGGW